jgi:23S rRNA (uracil-5-)-methyltransferase RumA
VDSTGRTPKSAHRERASCAEPVADGSSPGTDRIATLCRHADICGGCSILHHPYSDQLATKEAILRRLLGPLLPESTRSGCLFLPVRFAGEAPAHFRQKVAFAFGSGSSHGLTMGHYRRGSQQVVAVDECPVHSERGNRIAFALRDQLVRAGIPAAGPALTGVLRYLIVRTTADDREAIAMLVVTRNDKALRKPVRAFLESTDHPDGFFININTDPGAFMVGEHTVKIAGHSHVSEVVGGVSYLVSPTAFFQTNVRAAEVLQQYVIDSVRSASRVLDLYCGSGLFSLPIAARGIRVTGIEENRQAIRDAQANARLNEVPANTARFKASRVEDAVRALSREQWDAVILDPPRQGCSDDVLEAVFQEMRPRRVTYVSCNPETLGAELPGIVQCGYSVEELRAVDMFPHTEHIETVVRLVRTS